jgi:hypothetical protein
MREPQQTDDVSRPVAMRGTDGEKSACGNGGTAIARALVSTYAKGGMPMGFFARLIALLVTLLGLGAATASAQPPRTADTDGRLLLSAPMTIASAGLAIDDSRTGSDYNTLSANIGYGSLSGLGGSGAWLPSVELGYGLGPHWIVSVRGGLSGSTMEYHGEESSASGFEVGPGLTHAFAPGQAVRPTLGARAFYGHSSGDTHESSAVGAAARLGLQLHASEHFSVDPFVELSYSHSTWEDGPFEDGASFGRESDALGLSGGFSLSVWL